MLQPREDQELFKKKSWNMVAGWALYYPQQKQRIIYKYHITLIYTLIHHHNTATPSTIVVSTPNPPPQRISAAKALLLLHQLFHHSITWASNLNFISLAVFSNPHL